MCVQSCTTLCNLLDCRPWGSSVHGIFQARILEWVNISYSWGSSWPKDQNCFPVVQCKESTCHKERPQGSNLHYQERGPGGSSGIPPQNSYLGHPMDKGVWQATIHGVAKSWTQLRNWACTGIKIKQNVFAYNNFTSLFIISMLEICTELFWKKFNWMCFTNQRVKYMRVVGMCVCVHVLEINVW